MSRTLTQEECNMVIGALDSLGVALSEHEHQWTEGERTIYEQACAILGHPAINVEEV